MSNKLQLVNRQDRSSQRSDQAIIAAITRYFLEGGEQQLAALALSLDWSFTERRSGNATYVKPVITCGRQVYERLIGPEDSYNRDETELDDLVRALRIIGRTFECEFEYIDVRYHVPAFDPSDITELTEMALGKKIHNQAPEISGSFVHEWERLRFRSRSEVVIAEALERTGAVFLPNCRARIGASPHRRTIEADFVIIWKGAIGVLEIDGEPFHPPERRTQEQTRDRLWNRQGIAHVQHYDAAVARANPDKVVADFLRLLEGPR